MQKSRTVPQEETFSMTVKIQQNPQLTQKRLVEPLSSTYLEYLPSPVLVCPVARDNVEIPETLDGLRPQEVVGVVGLAVEVLAGAGLGVEV